MSYHAGEMIYAYGNVEKCPYDYRYDQSDIELSRTMLAYWANFAKYGNPNGDSLVNWPTYSPTTNSIMELGKNVGPIEDKYQELYPLIEEYIESVNK